MNREGREKVIVLFGNQPHTARGENLSSREAAAALRAMGYAPLIPTGDADESVFHWTTGTGQALIFTATEGASLEDLFAAFQGAEAPAEILRQELPPEILAVVKCRRIEDALQAMPQQATNEMPGHEGHCINCSFLKEDKAGFFRVLFETLTADEYAALDDAALASPPLATVSATYTGFPAYGSNDTPVCFPLATFIACLRKTLLKEVPQFA